MASDLLHRTEDGWLGRAETTDGQRVPRKGRVRAQRNLQRRSRKFATSYPFSINPFTYPSEFEDRAQTYEVLAMP